jgi:anaerobic ribonucleoside-triphosphate reductase
MIKSIKKRDGRIVDFQPEKIVAAIGKAFLAVGRDEPKAPADLAGRVVERAEESFSLKTPGVEDIQDIVERVLIDEGYADVAKAYILYRQRRSDSGSKGRFGALGRLQLSVNPLKFWGRDIWAKREVCETEMFTGGVYIQAEGPRW